MGKTEVTDAELSVLEVLWKQGNLRIRDIQSVLYPEASPSTYATVQKLLERLESKGCVSRSRSELARGPHSFKATVVRDDLIARQLQSMADRLCQGSLTPLLTHLVKGRPLTIEERGELRRLLDEGEKES